MPAAFYASQGNGISRLNAIVMARLKGSLLRNGAMQIWQRGTSFVSGATKVRTADGWEFFRTGGVAGGTLSRQAGDSTQYVARIQRDNTNAAVNVMNFAQSLETVDSRLFSGKNVIVKFKGKAGANFSPTSSLFTASIIAGTGTDENVLTGFTGANTFATNAALVASTTESLFELTGTVPASTTQLGAIVSWTPTGVAGVNDWLQVTEIQFCPGDGAADDFPYRLYAEELALCRRFYNKSFLVDTAPVQNAGTNTGESTWAAAQAGATAQRSPQIRFEVEMRIAPTITLFNPAAANAQVRDETAAADCSAGATANVNRKGLNVTATGAAGTAIAGLLGIHWTAEAEL